MSAMTTTLSEKDQKTLEGLLAKYNLQVEPKAEDPEARKKRAAEMRAQWDKMAKDAGLTPGEVWFKGKAGGNGGSLEITHRNPDNPDFTWKGIGQMPTWAREKLGKSFKDVRDLPHEKILELMKPFEV